MAITIEQFTTHLTQSGLMSADAIAAFQETLTTPVETVEELAKQLIQQNKLTKFQSQMIYQGKTKRLVLGNYILLNKIGAGGMGQVFLARHRRMKRIVALKTLPSAVMKDKTSVLRFQREVEAAAKLSHPNIVTAYDADEAQGLQYFVMEHVEGTDLSELVKRNGRLSIEKAVDYVLQAARGLEYAHGEGIVHRDIKPANVLLTNNGTVKILDLGLARLDSTADGQQEPTLTQTGAVMGTAAYMPPEQAEDTKQADSRSDIYSLGCLFYYLLTCEPVYSGDTIVKQIIAHREQPIPSITANRPDAPQILDAIFKKMVAKQPVDRFQSMSELITELESCGVIESPPAASTPMSEPAHPAFQSFLRDLEVNSPPSKHSPSPGAMQSVATRPSETKTRVTSQRETLPPGLLDETDSGGVAESRKKLWAFRPKKKLLAVVGGCFLAALILLAGILLKVDTPVGTIILEIDQPDLAGAVVSVDNEQKIKIKTGDGAEPIQVVADEKRHTLKVTKGGFETFSKRFTVKAGKAQTIRVWLEPMAAAVLKQPSASLVRAGTESRVVRKEKKTTDDLPALAIARFDFEQAAAHQKAWAKHLGINVETTNSIGMKMLLIPPGEFLMGSTEEERTRFLKTASAANDDWSIEQIPSEGPQHPVRITAPFLLSRHEITRGQFR